MFFLPNENIAEKGAGAEQANQHRMVFVGNLFESLPPTALDEPRKVIDCKWRRGALVNQRLENLGPGL